MSSSAAAGKPLIREAPLPERLDKAHSEGTSILLGVKEPEEGRYTTLSRITYQHGRAPLRPGEDAVTVKTPLDVRQETTDFKKFMRSKNFAFGFEGQHIPLVSESRGAMQAAVELRGSRPDAQHAHSEVQHERLAHVSRMRSSHVFPTSGASGGLSQKQLMNSTSRVSYLPHLGEQSSSSFAAGQQPPSPRSAPTSDVQRQRDIHAKTHFVMGSAQSRDWAAESSKFRTPVDKDTGASPERTAKSTTALVCSISLGAAMKRADQLDALKSLKQVDYKGEQVDRVAPVFASSSHHLVMGYAPKDLTSLQRASYSPTVFVSPTPTGAAVPGRK